MKEYPQGLNQLLKKYPVVRQCLTFVEMSEIEQKDILHKMNRDELEALRNSVGELLKLIGSSLVNLHEEEKSRTGGRDKNILI